MLQKLTTIAGTALLFSFGLSCGSKTANPTLTVTSEGQVQQSPAGKEAAKSNLALIRFVNTDLSSKGRDVWLDDRPLFTGIVYKGVSPFAEIRKQAVKLRLREANGKEDLAATNLEILAGAHYTLLAMGGDKGSSLLLAYKDDLRRPKSGHVRVRVINASKVDNLDLLRADGDEKIQSDVDAPGRARFSDVPAGIFEIRAKRRPTSQTLSKILLTPDRAYTLIVVGDRADRLELLRVEDEMLGEQDLP